MPGFRPVPILAKYMNWPNGQMPPDFYTSAFTMHASIMIFFVLIPLLVGTFGNYLIPLKIGAGDMAFPFLNGVAFWSALPAGTIMVAGFFLAGGAGAAGWTSYPPVSAMQFNGLKDFNSAIVPHGVLGFLQVQGSTWPTVPILINFIGLALMFGYIAAYYV